MHALRIRVPKHVLGIRVPMCMCQELQSMTLGESFSAFQESGSLCMHEEKQSPCMCTPRMKVTGAQHGLVCMPKISLHMLIVRVPVLMLSEKQSSHVHMPRIKVNVAQYGL